MRAKVFIPAMVVLLIALAILIWQQRRQSSLLSTLTSQDSQSKSNASKVPVVQNTNNISQSIVSLQNSQSPVQNDREKTNEIRQYMESLNVPINFYGKVIDQDGNPLTNARVQGEVLHLKVIAPVAGGSQDEIIPIDQKTDASGLFQVQDVAGRALQIKSIQKDGYEVEPDNCPHSFNTSVGAFENPTIFKMWSTNIHEQLITGEKKFQIVPDGKPYFIDLAHGEISQTEGGDLKVWIKYPSQTIRGQLYDWACELDVINGGLCQSDSYSMFSAPANGYEPKFQLQQQIKGGQYGLTGEKRFYVMLKNGQEYGRIIINLYAPYTDQVPGLIRLSYAINLSGSRILR